jgi:mRNA-degrading endonuclease toxin of MazEF toxin-antitoxin module
MHLRSVDQERLVASYGLVGSETMRKVEEALKVATGLVPT